MVRLKEKQKKYDTIWIILYYKPVYVYNKLIKKEK